MANTQARARRLWWVAGAVVIVWVAFLIGFGYWKSHPRGPGSFDSSAARAKTYTTANRADPRYGEVEQMLTKRYGGNIHIQIEGKPAEACGAGLPGGSCGEPTGRFRFEAVGPGLAGVYYRPDNGCYYVLGKVKVQPTGDVVEYGVVDKDGHSLGSREWWK